MIPVLVSGAQMPDRRDLPPELGAIARRNALELSDKRWRYDVGQLITTLEELLAETTAVDVAPATADVAAAAEASPEAAPTGPAPSPAVTGDREHAGDWLHGRGRLLAGVAALAVLGVVLAIVALGGGGDSGGGDPGAELVGPTVRALHRVYLYGRRASGLGRDSEGPTQRWGPQDHSRGPEQRGNR